jgi:hypothetical protein
LIPRQVRGIYIKKNAGNFRCRPRCIVTSATTEDDAGAKYRSAIVPLPDGRGEKHSGIVGKKRSGELINESLDDVLTLK